MTTQMSRTEHACWKCGDFLWRLTPPVNEYRYWCQRCELLTSPIGELEAAMAAKDPEALGIVAGAPCKIAMEPVEAGGSGT